MATPQEYYNTVIGKKFDMDGVYGAQCVDGFKHWCKTVINFDISRKSICSPSGYAYSIWDNFYSLGLDKYFTKVAPDKMTDGDWAIWAKGSKDCPVGHVAMFRKDIVNTGKGVFLGQNQSGHPEYTQQNISYNGLRGALRPKIYHSTVYTTGNYKTKFNMKVRSGAGVNFNQVKVSNLTVDGKTHATSQDPNANAIYKKGTVFTAKQIITNGNSIWAKSPSGYICIKDSETVYCEKC